MLPVALLLASCATDPPPPAPEVRPAVHLADALGAPTRAPSGDGTVRAVVVPVPTARSARVTVPKGGRLDVLLGAEGGPVQHRVTVDGVPVLDARVRALAPRSIDLTDWAGREVTLGFEATSEVAAARGVWATPVLQGEPVDRPNVLFYVIDGGGADLMSLYGYERPTTPHLEELAREAVVFERARTSSGWTKPSTASYMTSLHHSVLGGFTTNTDRIPDSAVTMAEHFHRAGYVTGVFTTNPFAGSMSGLEAGVDHFRDRGARHNSASSEELHADFFAWRARSPGKPWWAHIQTTDVHEPHEPAPPYAGLYTTEARRADFRDWWAGVHGLGLARDTVLGQYRARLEALGVAPRDFFRLQWDLYDETMTHNDATLGDLIDQLKARGEWEDTIFIVAADHGHPAGSFSRFGRGLVEPQPADWEGALADSWRTWVPLVVSWPGHLQAGTRVSEPVSMLDVLPTVLELAGLPEAPVQQGQSLVPLLTGEGAWQPRPVVLEQVQAYPPTGEMVGHIEIIDGRWAASLEVMPPSLRPIAAEVDSLVTAGGWRAARPHRPSTPRLLLYDLEADPHCLRSVHAEHPERVARYTAQLEALWAHHQELAARFEAGGAVEAGDAQMEALRTLGYVE